MFTRNSTSRTNGTCSVKNDKIQIKRLEFRAWFKPAHSCTLVSLFIVNFSDLCYLILLRIFDNEAPKDFISPHIFAPVYHSWKPVRISCGYDKIQSSALFTVIQGWMTCHRQLIIVPRNRQYCLFNDLSIRAAVCRWMRRLLRIMKTGEYVRNEPWPILRYCFGIFLEGLSNTTINLIHMYH
jgi:hypothetical protein